MSHPVLLTINAGSSSVRLTAFDTSEPLPRQLAASRIDFASGVPEELLKTFIGLHRLQGIAAVSHRVVHGGTHFTRTALLDAEAEHEISLLSELAPLHNPHALRWLAASQWVLGNHVFQVGVFDTAFYADLPAAASTYALPAALCRKHGIRRFGFHGLAHGSMWRSWRRLRPDLEGGGRVISLQLGSGCSATAISHGVPQDTSMGFSPLEGLVMATRCGDVDAGLLLYLQQVEKLSPSDLEKLLNNSSGLLGISEISGDMRELLPSSEPRAALAVDVYVARARKYIGAYLALLGGADAILFGGGVGENAPSIRERMLSEFQWCGLTVDSAANAAAVDLSPGQDVRISAGDSRIAVWVVAVDEAATLAQEALPFIKCSTMPGA